MKLQIMLKKKISIAFVIILFVISSVLTISQDRIYKVLEVKSPVNLLLDKGYFSFNDL